LFFHVRVLSSPLIVGWLAMSLSGRVVSSIGACSLFFLLILVQYLHAKSVVNNLAVERQEV
jgi:hypothetical protein